MPTLTFRTTVDAPLDAVWAFHEDVRGALPALTPPRTPVEVESADLPVRVGSRIVLRVVDPLGRRLRWVARVVEHRPPGGSSGIARDACFVDEQESGPFASWRHEHHFGEAGPRQTHVTDRITYRVPFGPIGWVADVLMVRRELRSMFRHRHDVTRRVLG